MKRSPLAVALLLAMLGGCGQQHTQPAQTVWSGTITLPAGTASSAITLIENGATGIVSLAPGGTIGAPVRLTTAGGGVRFRLPGVPDAIVFDGRRSASGISGSVVQGRVHGTFQLGRGGGDGASLLGAYRFGGRGGVEVIDLGRLGLPLWLVDANTGGFHAMYRSGSGYNLGGFHDPQPFAGSVAFTSSALRFTQPGRGVVAAERIPVRQEEVRFPSDGALIAGTLTVPASPGPHPAVAWVHGSGPSWRDEAQFFAGIMISHGIAMLAYDKRGNGSSTGTYPGELPSDAALSAYADDAAAAARFLARQPGLDRQRIGLTGGSQAGWVIPLALARAPEVAFAIIQSGPVVDVGETADFSSRTSQGEQPLSAPLARIDAQVLHDGPSGFDPQPLLRRLHVPILWLFGALDMNQPTGLDTRALRQLARGHDYTWRVFPHTNHGIFVTPTGLNAELATTPGMPAAFFSTITAWLAAHQL